MQHVEFSTQAKVCAGTLRSTPSESFSPHLACMSVRSSLLFLCFPFPWLLPGGAASGPCALGRNRSVPAPTKSHPLPCMAEHSTVHPWTYKEKLLVTFIRKQAGYFHRTVEEGKHRAGLAHLCQHSGFWPMLKLAIPAEHGGGGRSSAEWKALVSWAWHGCGRREGAVLTAPRRSHRSCHHVSPPFWQPQPAWPSSAVKKAEQAPGLVLPPETA